MNLSVKKAAERLFFVILGFVNHVTFSLVAKNFIEAKYTSRQNSHFNGRFREPINILY